MEGFWLGVASPGCSLGAACDHDTLAADTPSRASATTLRIVLLLLTSSCLRGCCAQAGRLRLLERRSDIARWARPRSTAGTVRSPAAIPVSPECPWRDDSEYGYSRLDLCRCWPANHLPSRERFPYRARRHTEDAGL